MKKAIKGYYHITNTDVDKFNKDFENAVNLLQDDGQELEIQYQTQSIAGILIYSVLILGRVEWKEKN